MTDIKRCLDYAWARMVAMSKEERDEIPLSDDLLFQMLYEGYLWEIEHAEEIKIENAYIDLVEHMRREARPTNRRKRAGLAYTYNQGM